VQRTRRAVAEVAAIMDGQPCGQPLCCYRTDVLDHRIEVYNGRAGTGMQSSGQTSGACIEFDHARFRLSSCEGKAKDDVKALPGSRKFGVAHENCMAGDHQIWESPTHVAAVFVSRGIAALHRAGGQTRAGSRLVCGGSEDAAARALEVQASRPPTHASDCSRASQGAR
jgi:hypothetical protein